MDLTKGITVCFVTVFSLASLCFAQTGGAGKQPGFKGSSDAATTGVVTGRFEVLGKSLELD